MKLTFVKQQTPADHQPSRQISDYIHPSILGEMNVALGQEQEDDDSATVDERSVALLSPVKKEPAKIAEVIDLTTSPPKEQAKPAVKGIKPDDASLTDNNVSDDEVIVDNYFSQQANDINVFSALAELGVGSPESVKKAVKKEVAKPKAKNGATRRNTRRVRNN
jgi:hypothetical protein